MDIHSASTVSDRIVEALLDQIGSSNMSAGDSIASERQLMQGFNVSRLACREALAKLQGMGILKTRHGKRTFLADIDDSFVNPSVLKLLLAQGTISNADVIETRLMVEPSTAKLAAIRASDEKKSQLVEDARRISDDLHKLSILERAERFAAVDVAFHREIAVASGNAALPMILKNMHELLVRIRLEALIQVHPTKAYVV